MNEQIKKLLKQATIHAFDSRFDDEDNPRPLGDVIQEKFAELIIQECVGVADTYIQTGEHARPTSRSTIGRLIKEHFGVEQ